MQSELNAMAHVNTDIVGPTDQHCTSNEITGARLETFDDHHAFVDVSDRARRAYREGIDCPIQPMLCYDKRGWVALCLAGLTVAKHYVAMSRLDMSAPCSCLGAKGLENTGANRIFEITLSGKTRRFHWYRHQFIFNQKIKLPIDEMRTGVAKLNVRMIVDGCNYVCNCPFVPERFAGRRSYFSGPFVPRRRYF